MKTLYGKSKLKELLTTKVAKHRILEGILQSEKKDKHNKEIIRRKMNAATFIKQKHEEFSNMKRLKKK